MESVFRASFPFSPPVPQAGSGLVAMRREKSFRQTVKRLLDDSIHAGRSLAEPHAGALPAYDRLRRHVQSRTTLLRASGRPGDNRNLLDVGLGALALHRADWLRPVEEWQPRPGPAWPLFTSLAHHLFGRYPVPPFMTSAWFDLPRGEALPQHAWYKHLGLGQSIRTAGLPLRFTRDGPPVSAGGPTLPGHRRAAVGAGSRAGWARGAGACGRGHPARPRQVRPVKEISPEGAVPADYNRR